MQQPYSSQQQPYPPPSPSQSPYYPPPPQSQNGYYPPPPQAQSYSPQKSYSQPPSYAQQPNPYSQQQAPSGPYASNPQTAEDGGAGKVRPSSGYKDVWAAILWLCNLGGFIALSVIGLGVYHGRTGSFGGTPSATTYSGLTFDTSTLAIFGFAAIVGFGISFLYLMLANIFPKPLIYITLIGSIIVYFGVTIYYFTQHYYSAAIVFLIFSCLYLCTFWWWRSRIPFATVMLQTITSITRRYPSTIIVGLISLIVQTAFSIWFALTVIGVYEAYYSTSSNNARLNVAMVFLVFSFYWTSQVITYVTHVILAGIFATVYFLDNSVKHPIWGSTRRALTTSFGSICFGALIIAFVNFVRYFLSVARANTDSPILGFLICIVQCIVGCFQGLLEWFTYYAFSGVAIYGMGFIPSAKNTWRMIKDRGIEAMINDNLIGNVLFMGKIICFYQRFTRILTTVMRYGVICFQGGLLVGVLCSLLGFIYLKAANPAYNQGGGMTPVVVLVCFLLGSSMFSSIATVISSGVATTFLCLAEDPDALRRSKPMLYEKIRETWPRVVQGV
ncbi:plasma-membrane choline transporter-domain-containing protein [Radiomyces spectabilis]|uniref:plasma-membrane choline transporter-domain-containing protein n=1 Tax=Radiomyces spectabilis TaxID=64574 RepID=UPI0022202635|nr:plasma-membrane choline transporter-domain-containing protein [Radiomyces spectabilis]KAI8376125.1 plasma-membrane choline transporter-domain-containing protein [Radiomyces spectabilis]